MKTASLIRRVEASITTAIPMVVIAVAMLIVLNTFIPLLKLTDFRLRGVFPGGE